MDEAFFDSNMVDEAEVDPDIFHNRSKNINILDIKKALTKRFKPEQIRHFGNNHIIYPSLSSQNFWDLITKELSSKSAKYKQIYNLDIGFEESFVDLVFNNRVFPTQGVRPLFSTISQIADVNVSKILPRLLEKGHKKAVLGYQAYSQYT